MAKMRARRISGSRWVTRSGSRPSGIARASRSAMPSRRSAWASNMTPPSELIRPPSKAAVIFLRRTAGKQNGRRLSSVMAGVRASIPAKGWLQQPNPTPDQQLTLLPPPLIRPRHEYDRLVSTRDYSAVSAACMMSRSRVFTDAGGFDERLATDLYDADYCLRVGCLGYKVLNDAYAVLYRYESANNNELQRAFDSSDSALFGLRWQKIIDSGDPYYSPLFFAQA